MQSEKLHKRTGTPLYMAPELFMRYYGIESDQWALGIMMYQLLSGHLPFWDAQSDRSPLAVMSAILNKEVSGRNIMALTEFDSVSVGQRG